MNIKGIKFANPGIFQMIFRDDMNMGFRLRQERDLNFLFFDDVAGSQGCGAASEAAGRAKQQSAGQKSTCGGAQHDLKIVTGEKRTCKG